MGRLEGRCAAVTGQVLPVDGGLNMNAAGHAYLMLAKRGH